MQMQMQIQLLEFLERWAFEGEKKKKVIIQQKLAVR